MEQIKEASYMRPGGYGPKSCGYCRSKPRRSSCDYFAWSDVQRVHPIHYQQLVDRGWRRSGTAWYKPDVRNSCCPHYTIRLPVSEFRPRKDQRKAVNQFNDFVLGIEYKRMAARLCPRTRAEKRLRRDKFFLEETVHRPEYCAIKRPLDPATKSRIEPAHTFEVTLEADTYTEEKYALFENYQRVVHKEPPSKISKHGFRSFLCSGMQRSTYEDDGKLRQVGSFHQCYRLDGRLVAIGVLDLLPYAVSAVYMMYHEDVIPWEFGKMSALREITLAIEGGYQYYYMGFYIHGCTKMMFKRTFMPTYVLDPETYDWDFFSDDIAARLSARKYVSLSRELRLGLQPPTSEELVALSSAPEDSQTDAVPGTVPDAESVFDTDMPGLMTMAEIEKQVSLADIKVKQKGTVFDLGHFTGWDQSQLLFIAEFVACVGPELARQIVIDLN